MNGLDVSLLRHICYTSVLGGYLKTISVHTIVKGKGSCPKKKKAEKVWSLANKGR